MPELDWEALAQQARSGDLGAVEAALGVKLTKKALADLEQCFEDVWERDLSVASVLALVSRALQHPEGLAWERYDRRGSVLQLLAVRWKDKEKERVTVGIDANYSGKSLGGVWPLLARWKPKLEANGELARAWARDAKQKSRVVLELTRAPAPPKRAPDADEAALRAAIVANPADDAPRLVYADWLLEHGDVRGEFIRLQIEHARDPRDAKREKRLAALLDASLESLVGEPAAHTHRNFVTRGFATRVSLTPAAFLRDGERLFSSWPLEELQVDAPKFTAKQLEQLAQAPAMDRVRHLIVSQRRPRDPRRPLAALARGKRFASLRTLELGCCGESAKDWRELISNLEAPNLEVLDLHYGVIHPELYRALGEARHLPRLREYREYFFDTPGKVTAVEWKAGLAALAAREGLEALTLSQCEHLNDAALSVLFAKKAKARWKRLHLVNPEASDALLKALLAWPGVDQLEALQINNGHFTLAGVLPLLKLPRLHTLAFTGGAWSDADVAALLRAMEALPKKHPLRRINLPGAGLEKHRRFELTTD